MRHQHRISTSLSLTIVRQSGARSPSYAQPAETGLEKNYVVSYRTWYCPGQASPLPTVTVRWMVLLAPGAPSKRAQQLLNRPTRLWCRCPDAQLPNDVASTAVSACLLLAGKALWLAVRLIWHNKFFF
jgi:hypothetical protein